MKKDVIYSSLLIPVIFGLCVPEIATSQSVTFDGKIVFTQGSIKENRNDIFLLNKTKTQLTSAGLNISPQWSPDGKYILFSLTNRQKNVKREIYLMNADGTGQLRLTNSGKGISTDPQWSADGRGIFFQTGMPGVKQVNLLDLTTCRVEGINGNKATPKLMDCNKNPIRKLEIDFNNRHKDYEKKLKELREISRQRIGLFEIYPSPNDKYMILYFRKTGRLELCDAKGTTIKDFNANQAGRPAWAKDSKKIAYSADSTGSSPEPVLVIYDLEKSHYEEIKFGMGPDIGCGGEMSWDRDSKHIVYSCGRPFSEEDDSWLYILDLQTKKSEKLIQGNSPDWY
jgi:hypothetical protein